MSTETPTVTAPAESAAYWLGVAEALSARLATDALERDRANRNPVAETQLLRESGLPNLLIPIAQGGAGQTWEVALGAVRRLARGDASIAQVLGYHYVNLANLWLAGGPAVQELLGRASAENTWVWGDAVNPIDPDLTLAPVEGGYRLNGTKSFSTGASVGDVIVIAAVDTATAEPLLAAVPAESTGVTFGGDWDNLGQRLSASGSTTYSDVFIPTEHVIGSLAPERTTAASSLITPAIQAVFGNLYVGAAEGALAAAKAYTTANSRPWVLGGQDSVTDEPYVLATYGAFAAKVQAAAALAEQVNAELAVAAAAGTALTWEQRGELAVRVAALKVVGTDVALEVTAGIYEVTGARSTANRYGLDLYWRNVRTHSLHDPVAYKRREVGLHFLTGAHPEFTLYT